ncbi:MAG: DUF998 domain-containing protein [Streptococcaceae bacterium]|nr:DUF998 domain-containing protein [Streptococcaceae bacterium]MCL2681313.1 DUF998 domain-containing protein [Streptococcaceae bacterium]
MSKKYLEVSDEILEQLQPQSEEYTAKVENNQLVVKSKTTKFTENLNFSLRWLLVPTVIALIVSLCVFLFMKESQIALSGTQIYTLSSISTLLGTVIGFITFLVINWKEYSKKAEDNRLLVKSRQILTITISYVAVALVGQVLMFNFISHMFQGASFDPITASLLVSLFTSVIFYFLISRAIDVSVSKLIHLLFIIMVGGILISVMSNSHTGWWKENFSFLGTAEASDRWQFEITMVLTGVVLMTITDYLFSSFKRNNTFYNWKIGFIRISYYLIGIFIACIGIFPANIGSWTRIVHNLAAFGVVIITLLLISFLKFLLPQVSKEFVVLSTVVLVALVAGIILFMKLHYLSLTVFEMFAFALIFMWMVLLMDVLQEIAGNDDKQDIKIFNLEELKNLV